MHLPWSAQAMRASVNEMEAILPAFAWPNYVLGNHDQPRLATRFGGLAQARLAGLMLLTLRGTPTVYYGDEIGLENGKIPPEKIQDPQGINLGAERSRDVCRTPMQWDSSQFAGFSKVEPWLPVTDDYTSRNVAAQSADPSSMLNFYKRLFWLRRSSPALYGGSYRVLDAGEDCFAYLRGDGTERKLVALNFSNWPLTVKLPFEGQGKLLLSTHPGRPEVVALPLVMLDAFEGILLDL
jgi:alpha-glucosidase